MHHYALLPGHPGGRKLCQSILKDMYWPALAVDCYTTVRNGPTISRNRIQQRENVQQLQLLPETAPFK